MKMKGRAADVAVVLSFCQRTAQRKNGGGEGKGGADGMANCCEPKCIPLLIKEEIASGAGLCS